MKLFAVYIGGDHARATIELHDMRFVAAPTIEDTYDELRRQWWGVPASLHVDCWAELTHADGYRISLHPEPAQGELKLFFVNLGGYDPKQFTELHHNVFVVASSPAAAKARALTTVGHWTEPHKDALYEAERAFALDSMLQMTPRQFIHLEKIDDGNQPSFTCFYNPIGRKKPT